MNTTKILEHESVKEFKKKFQRELKKNFKEKMSTFEDVQALLFMLKGDAIESMKDLRIKVENEINTLFRRRQAKFSSPRTSNWLLTFAINASRSSKTRSKSFVDSAAQVNK